jgi:hypothetical protein
MMTVDMIGYGEYHEARKALPPVARLLSSPNRRS